MATPWLLPESLLRKVTFTGRRCAPSGCLQRLQEAEQGQSTGGSTIPAGTPRSNSGLPASSFSKTKLMSSSEAAMP